VEKDKLLNSPAYRMFIEELDKHLKTASTVLSELAGNSALNTEQRTRLSTAFHTIRGGAGFFALSEIALCARTLEEKLGTAPVGNDTEEIRKLVHGLMEMALSLPR